MKSRLYIGSLRHRRHTPREHAFKYRVFMPYLRLDEVDAVLGLSRLWSRSRFAPASFCRDDFLGDPAKPLDAEVRRRITEETGATPAGPIYVLANLRYFGMGMNPIICYYCFSEDESRLEYLVAEVTNTPWDERHSYVLSAEPGQRVLRQDFPKTFHVSPFNPMDMEYSWRSNVPGERLAIHLENHRDGERVFDATLALEAEPITAASLRGILWRFPLMTAKVAGAIYWQALKLFIKRIPYHPHPGTSLQSGAP
ncbi:DUF1365 domain-containing protein [Congregibacter litoralis]|uniref:DUF1365 domain-containing protein n=1 Tax=Congregibacter litoralis KT71 TaxID=314285 RepID=A4A8P9_9GAMM|nr:DUF1365 domain-containing protein [Congregibacter litoralis]EAQ97441.2 hypothetical protein KT71_04010 [Congregibacter litoralis KT71]